MRRKLGACFLFITLAASACSDDDDKKGHAFENVTDWTCCAFGETTGTCVCFENTPNDQHICGPSAVSCTAPNDQCCIASLVENAWVCECGDGSSCPTAQGSESKSVPRCPR
jgi:hypothetical protein